MVFLTPLVTPDKTPDEIPVYDISSDPICTKFVPEVGNCVASFNCMPVVCDELIPPDKLVTASPDTVPLH